MVVDELTVVEVADGTSQAAGGSLGIPSLGALAAIGSTFFIIMMAICIFMIACQWKVFKKAGHAGWKSIVPILNAYVLFDIAWGKGIMFLLMLVPFANFVVLLITMFKLSKAFGYGTGMGLVLTFLSPIGMAILAFGNSEYVGAGGEEYTPKPTEFDAFNDYISTQATEEYGDVEEENAEAEEVGESYELEQPAEEGLEEDEEYEDLSAYDDVENDEEDEAEF